jgi:hypothetical protein
MEQSKQNQDPHQSNQPASPPEWPQPQGIFTNGTHFHPLVFLDKIKEMNEKVVIEKASGDLLMEHKAFARLLTRRMVVLDDQLVLFKIFDLACPPSTAEVLIIVHEGDKYLRLECLQQESMPRNDGQSLV